MREYFISPNGSDDSAGTLEAPWRSLAKASETTLYPGDRVYLQGGQVHAGSLLLLNAKGTSEKPIIVSSYGTERARIESGSEGGILIWNTGGFHISELEIVGVGYPENYSHGICLFADKGGENKWESVVIEDVEISGFGCAGIAIGSKGPNGFRDVTIRNAKAHHNAYAGIFAWGEGQEYSHQNVSIFSSTTYLNSGIPGLVHPSGHGIHSGHGILLSCVDIALVEKCIAYENGKLNTSHNCGPAGIWASNSKRVVFKQNESFSNKTAAATDGGGFGFDGGVNDSLMEDNFSHDNDGPGFLFAQYYGAKTFRNNRLLGNRSENDGRHNDNGSIHIWGPQDDLMQDLLIQGNEVQLTKETSGRPRALFIDARTKNLKFIDNKLTGDMVSILMEVAPLQRDFVMRGNLIQSPKAGVLWHGRFHRDVDSWLKLNPQGPIRETLSV